MAKQQLRTRQTNLNTPEANGQQVERTYTVDDSFLPCPQELKEYQNIHPGIVDMLIDASRNEQNHRHYLERQKIKVIKNETNKIHLINFIGMFFAFLIMAIGLGLSAFLLYKEKEVLGSIFGGITILIAVTSFLSHVKSNNSDKRNKE